MKEMIFLNCKFLKKNKYRIRQRNSAFSIVFSFQVYYNLYRIQVNNNGGSDGIWNIKILFSSGK